MNHEEFVKKHAQNEISAGIDESIALMLINQLPNRYRAAHLFWSWIWILSIPASICIAIFYKWWVGLLLLLVGTPMIFRSTKESAAQFVLAHAIQSEEFFNFLVDRKVLLLRETSESQN